MATVAMKSAMVVEMLYEGNFRRVRTCHVTCIGHSQVEVTISLSPHMYHDHKAIKYEPSI